MRVSGVLLIFLALGHYGYMHVLHGVEEVNYQFVVAQYATPFWRAYDFVLLTLAMIHATNGGRLILDDYVHARGWRAFSLAALYTISFVFLVIGAVVIVTFQPAAG
jgi:succinate dehydrogenase / fumarate reductase membrane anchor subunit